MRRITTLTAATLAAAALAGTVGVSAASAATPTTPVTASTTLETTPDTASDTASAQAVYHRTFVFTNASSYTLALAGYSGTHDDDELPFPDRVVLPGQEIAFNVAYRFMEQRGVEVHFTVWDPAGNRLADFRPFLRVDFGAGLVGLEMREIPDQLGWLPPDQDFTHPQIMELYDRIPPAAAPQP